MSLAMRPTQSRTNEYSTSNVGTFMGAGGAGGLVVPVEGAAGFTAGNVVTNSFSSSSPSSSPSNLPSCFPSCTPLCRRGASVLLAP